MIYFRRRKLLFLLLLFSPLFNYSVHAADTTKVIFFYEAGCPHCARVDKFLKQRIKPNYPVVIKKYEIHKSDNANLLLRLVDTYNAEEVRKKGTPAVFVGDRAFHGDKRITMREIEETVRSAVNSEVSSPISRLSEERENIKKQLTIPAVIGASAVDAINPCSFGVLTLLLGTILLISKSGRRKRVINAGLAFTAAIFICYLLMGFGLFYVIQLVGIEHYIYWAVSIIAILVGLWNIKDYFWHERWLNIEVPKYWRPKLKRITSGVTSVPGSFFTGCLCSLFLLPCSSGPYIVIIGMLSDTVARLQAVWFLLLYNCIFILPFIIITLAVGFGLTTTARVEKWRQVGMEKLHLATGIVMLVLGITLITLLGFRII